jgi:hypothetical protein
VNPDADPVEECQQRLTRMRAGQFEGVTAEEATEGAEAAHMDLGVGWGGRRIGWGLIKAFDLYEGGDWQQAWFAISDGERYGAVLASLSGSEVAAARNRGEDPVDVLRERLRDMLIPNNIDHFAQVALSHPIRL